MRRDVVDIRDIMENQVTSVYGSTILSGSCGEGFRLKGSDQDVMHWPNNHRVIWDLSQSQYYNTRRETLILCDCSDSPPGFTLLYLLSPSMRRVIQRACVRKYNRLYISSSIHRQIMCSPTTTPHRPQRKQHGPCATYSLGTTEYDIAFCFASDFWPPSASSWIDRCHSWPQPHVANDILRTGCLFVAIGHKLGRHENHEWRISFSLAEQKLVYAMSHCQFLTYGLLKLFLTEIINNSVGNDDKLLCSYHIKTAVFWVIQQNIIPYWCPQNLLEGFWVRFKLLLKWVYEGICPNFFIPDNNMFISKIHGNKQHQLFTRLYCLYEKGLVFLLQIPSIRSYIIDVLHNPTLSVCTDEQTLISEADFDVNLISEINCIITVPISNMQQCMKYLQTIERMIGLPLLTQYQGLMLQRFTVSVLQNASFILHMKTYENENRLRYRADKISCHMLKLAAKFGCITDMMYIAMYYYKTLRYLEALSIIDMIKVKLAQPYVMHYDAVDTVRYTEALEGQTWSTKMRQAVALDVRLYKRIHYIPELILELQPALQIEVPALQVPHLVMIYMLEILCYIHVDIMKIQTALDDLQTLVHYDPGQIIHVNFRDIPWHILGICQHVTGNLQAALYSYQQSLRHLTPFYNIQTITGMRISEIIE
ncbi:uncharacterized protein LOC134234575 [Saccostrea cucullata]|uniref:uncharacterized protein LOC134234575 n=1 Tax=Saccostrea cuccullata TaxID=36930 RepID=UPI002ED21D1F